MTDVARNHHFIPAFLLAKFTPSGTKDDYLWVTDMKERKGYSTKPRTAGFQKELYLVNVEGARPDIIETILGRFEGIAAPAVNHVLEQHTLPTHHQLGHLMELIGLLVVKVPAALARAQRTADLVIKTMLRPYFENPSALRTELEQMRKESVEGIDYEELARFIQNENLYTVSVDNTWLLVQMCLASLLVQRMIFKRNWTILVATDSAGGFICSDAPVCLTWTDMRRQTRMPRPDECDTTITVPLGKRVALRGRYEPGQPPMEHCDRDAVACINLRTISSGDRFIYSSGKDFSLKRDDGSIGTRDNLITDLEAIHKRNTNDE